MISHKITSLAISPLLLTQGLITRLRVPRWAEPPGARSGISGSGPSIRLLVLGDSAAAGVGASHQSQALIGKAVSALATSFTVDWELDAITGATTASTLRRLADRSDGRFDVVVTSLGVNDVVSHVRLSVWRAKQAELRRELLNRFGAKLVIVSGLPPVHGFPALPQPLRWHLGWMATVYDSWLQKDLAGEPDCQYLSLRFSEDQTAMSGDGFHPGPRIYAEWGRRVAELTKESNPV